MLSIPTSPSTLLSKFLFLSCFCGHFLDTVEASLSSSDTESLLPRPTASGASLDNSLKGQDEEHENLLANLEQAAADDLALKKKKAGKAHQKKWKKFKKRKKEMDKKHKERLKQLKQNDTHTPSPSSSSSGEHLLQEPPSYRLSNKYKKREQQLESEIEALKKREEEESSSETFSSSEQEVSDPHLAINMREHLIDGEPHQGNWLQAYILVIVSIFFPCLLSIIDHFIE